MDLLWLLPVLLFSVVVHEYAHGWVALRNGDDTAYRAGRLTLNPIPHLDLVGSIAVPLILWFAQAGFLFGWARPVPVDPRNFREYRKGDIQVSLAGIAANLILAFAFTLLMAVVVGVTPALGLPESVRAVLVAIAGFGVLINLILALFNLIPIPPLDGSHVVYHLLPPRLGAHYRAVGRFGILILLAILFFVPGLLRAFLQPVYFLWGVAQSFVALLT